MTGLASQSMQAGLLPAMLQQTAFAEAVNARMLQLRLFQFKKKGFSAKKKKVAFTLFCRVFFEEICFFSEGGGEE